MPRHSHQRPDSVPGLRPKTTAATLAAATAVLCERSLVVDRDVRLRRTCTSADELIIAPIVGGVDVAPGSGGTEWRNRQHKMAWFEAQRDLVQIMSEAGWTAHGACPQGTYVLRPGQEQQRRQLAAAPAGAPERLLAIAAELGIEEGDLDEAVREAAHEAAAGAYNDGAHPELDDESAHDRVHDDADKHASNVNNSGLATQLTYLFEWCASEAALRSLLRDLRD